MYVPSGRTRLVFMPRRTAAERHTDSAPPADLPDAPSGAVLIDALIALHHPVRRRIFETLTQEGPATVGDLARRLGLPVGSISHHLKPLHRAGFVVPAPELARDTRESWWRGVTRRLSWSSDRYTDGSVGRQVADTAERANLDYLTAAVVRWMRDRDTLPQEWRHGLASDTFLPATAAQMEDLAGRITALVERWTSEVRADAEEHPDAERRPVRMIARVFPSEPGSA
ncbi:helix-turn-helix domain-containing protein [Luteimicrobium xylanilyticum]